MREIRKSGSMRGRWKRSHGRNEAPACCESSREQQLLGPTATAPAPYSTEKGLKWAVPATVIAKASVHLRGLMQSLDLGRLLRAPRAGFALVRLPLASSQRRKAAEMGVFAWVSQQSSPA
jgi:hypothetical protein